MKCTLKSVLKLRVRASWIGIVCLCAEGIGNAAWNSPDFDCNRNLERPSSEWGKLDAAQKEQALAVLRSDTAESVWLRDAVLSDWVIEKLHSLPRTALLLFGNPESFSQSSPARTATAESLPERFEQLKAVVDALISENFAIFYDADSALAPVIREWTGGRAVGLSGGSRPASGLGTSVLRIQNIYRRLEIFRHFSKVYATADSISAAAAKLDIGSRVEWVVPSVLAENVREPAPFSVALNEWGARARGYGLGISRLPESLVWTDAHALLRDLQRYDGPYSDYRSPTRSKDTKGRGGRESRESREYIDKLYQAAEAISSADGLTQWVHRADFGQLWAIRSHLRSAQAYDVQSRSFDRVDPGAVFFGSGKLVPDMARAIYDVGYALGVRGIPVRHGGSGGLMAVVAAGAFDAGGESIGIPLGGGSRISSELIDEIDFQTLTLASAGYQARIPLMLHGAPTALIGPGGLGTLQEISALLLQESEYRTERLERKIIFISRDYYGPLVDGIKDSQLPASLRSRIELLDSAAEMEKESAGPDSVVVAPRHPHGHSLQTLLERPIFSFGLDWGKK